MTTPDDMQELIELLPFYVNGTLAPDMRAQIEAALPTSALLRDALSQERALQNRVVAGTEEILEQSEPHYEAREAGVMAQTASPARAIPQTETKGLSAALSFLNPRRWSPAVALTLALAIPVQAAVIASQAGNIARLEKENFELASGPCDDRDRNGGIVIILKEEAEWKAVTQLLDAESLTIINSGAFGVLTVRGDKTGAEREVVIKRLKLSPVIDSAEPEA